MDLQILQDKLNELANELKDIRTQLEEAENEQQKSRRWKPQVGDFYYFVNGSGGIVKEIWKDCSIDRARYTIGNCYKTREEGEFELERLKVIAEMREFEERPDYKWDGDNVHYYIHYKFGIVLSITNTHTIKHNGIYFESGEKAKECISKVGVDRIKRFYCRVKED